MDICSNPLQSLFCQLTCSNSKILLRRRSDRFELRSTDSCTISTICCVRVLGRPEWQKRSEDFVLRLTAVPYVSNLLTQSWMTDLWSSLSISENVMKLLWNLLDRATLIIIFHTEDTVMELKIWYRFLSNPFSWHVLKFKLHWYKIVIRVTKNVRGAGFFGTPCIVYIVYTRRKKGRPP